MNIPVDLMIKIISSSQECKDYLTTRYPYEYEIWTRFSTRNGNHCEIARAAIRRIFQFEYKAKGEHFLGSVGSEVWGSKKYQEHSS
jgi:hypothetical protein